MHVHVTFWVLLTSWQVTGWKRNAAIELVGPQEPWRAPYRVEAQSLWQRSEGTFLEERWFDHLNVRTRGIPHCPLQSRGDPGARVNKGYSTTRARKRSVSCVLENCQCVMWFGINPTINMKVFYGVVGYQHCFILKHFWPVKKTSIFMFVCPLNSIPICC